MKLYGVLVARTEYSIFKDQRKLKGKKIFQIAAKETMDPELIDFVDWQKNFSCSVPTCLMKTKLAKAMPKTMVNDLGLTLTKEDLQNVVDLMEPYGQITNMWTTKTKLPHVVWVAGRGPIAALLPNYDVVDNLWWGPDDNPTVYHHDNALTALSIRDNHEYRMAAKVKKDLERIILANSGIRDKEAFYLQKSNR
ncbi:hypothetical protein L2E82_01186 [Cichorium intybus]|uniref:Uncharacterized protein n=1 Tax=Cichorium intybus TaxID=13427 RepID=A0ACB9GZN2_CICIN|nr:hypothetical protein L2E82_01186 [Cichorium intybus]